MGRYTIRRLLQMIPVIIGTTLLIFLMVWALPGNPFAGRCGDRPCPDAYVAGHDSRSSTSTSRGTSSTGCTCRTW